MYFVRLVYRHLRIVPVGFSQPNTQGSGVTIRQKTSFAPASGLVHGIRIHLWSLKNDPRALRVHHRPLPIELIGLVQTGKEKMV
jgi:hypothetical protein